MSLKELVVEIDREIARLEEARDLLAGHSGPTARRSGTGRKRTLSAEDRRRISDGMKRRWAERRKLSKAKASQ